MTITEFLNARLDEERAEALHWDGDGRARIASMWTGGDPGYVILANDHGDDVWIGADGDVVEDVRQVRVIYDPARVLAEVEAKRRIVALHEQWPVLVEGPPEVEMGDPTDLGSMAARMAQRVAWLTTQEYRKRFGDEPPTSPMLAALAEVYADHPDYDEAWRP